MNNNHNDKFCYRQTVTQINELLISGMFAIGISSTQYGENIRSRCESFDTAKYLRILLPYYELLYDTPSNAILRHPAGTVVFCFHQNRKRPPE